MGSRFRVWGFKDYGGLLGLKGLGVGGFQDLVGFWLRVWAFRGSGIEFHEGVLVTQTL